MSDGAWAMAVTGDYVAWLNGQLAQDAQQNPGSPDADLMKQYNNALTTWGRLAAANEGKNLPQEQRDHLAAQALQMQADAARTNAQIPLDKEASDLARARLGLDTVRVTGDQAIAQQNVDTRVKEALIKQQEIDLNHQYQMKNLDLDAAKMQMVAAENELDRIFSREKLGETTRSADVAVAGAAGNEATKGAYDYMRNNAVPTSVANALTNYIGTGDASKFQNLELPSEAPLNPNAIGAKVASNERQRLSGFQAPYYTRPEAHPDMSQGVQQPAVDLGAVTSPAQPPSQQPTAPSSAVATPPGEPGPTVMIDGRPATPQELAAMGIPSGGNQ